MVGRSINTNLLLVTEVANQVFKEQQQLDVIYTDFQKAFDKVNHEILLKKFSNYRLSSNLLRLLKSYVRILL